MFVNVLSTKDFRYGQGQALGQDQFDQQEDGQWVTHSYFHDDELDGVLKGLALQFKEARTLLRRYQGELIQQGFIDYIVQK